ncbi:MAG: LysR family transcriptional regulator [Chryseolinea sp.]
MAEPAPRERSHDPHYDPHRFRRQHIGHGKIRLLELIAEHGSISQAAREMPMSYRRAWLLADEVNTMFDEPVLETQHGGAGGGTHG